MARLRRTLRKPSGLCRWRHHGLCELNSVSMLRAELMQHVVDLDGAIIREEPDIRSSHVRNLDQVIMELWLVRGKMAACAARNHSPVEKGLSPLFRSVRTMLDTAVGARKGDGSE